MNAKYLAVAALLALFLVTVFPVNVARADQPTRKFWAVLVCSADDESSLADTEYMYYVLTNRYHFDGIYYLSSYSFEIFNPCDFPEVNANASVANFRWAITHWLAERSDSDDVILIFNCGHGGGYNTIELANCGGRPDINLDENKEFIEDAVGMDLNGDGLISRSTWGGIDECMKIQTGYFPNGSPQRESYYDDEFASDLNTLNGKYDKLIFLDESCFSGGFIDDISGPNRIIITATNETYFADAGGDPYYPPGHQWFSPWAGTFIDALNGKYCIFNATALIVAMNAIPPSMDQLSISQLIIPNGTIVNSDSNGDGYISIFEAWNYAWNHDPARLNGDETPWLDDNGNGLPTYDDGGHPSGGVPPDYGTSAYDVLDPTDGSSASITFLENVPLADSTPPSVSIMNMKDGEIVSNRSVLITVSASDDVGVQKVVFWVDSELKTTDTTNPYQCSWNTTSYTTSRHIIKAVAYDTSNNTNSDQRIVYIDRHDVAVTAVMLTFGQYSCKNLGLNHGAVYPDWGVVQVKVTTKNEGSYNEAFSVSAYYGDPIFLGDDIVSLSVDTNVDLCFYWNVIDAPEYGQTYGVVVRASIVKGENDTADNYNWDNTVKVRLRGDANGDGAVNINDYSIIEAHLGEQFSWGGPGQYAWQADFNGDGTVNQADLDIWSANRTDT